MGAVSVAGFPPNVLNYLRQQAEHAWLADQPPYVRVMENIASKGVLRLDALDRILDPLPVLPAVKP